MESDPAFMMTKEKVSEISNQIKRKRPNITRLDIEKLFQESIELTELHKALTKENQALQNQYQKVQANKINRQNFISAVEKLVKIKAEDASMKNNQQTSWLAFNLNKKIFDLKSKIDQKENIIRNLQFTKENQELKKYQIELNCLKEIMEFAKTEKLVGEADSQNNEEEEQSLKEIFWIQNYVEQEKKKLIGLKMVVEQEEREIKNIMKELAMKKAQLKNIKEMENQYMKAQENYQEEKKRKEQTLLGKKNYISSLSKKKEQEQQKLQNLKEKYEIINQEENDEIEKLERTLKELQELYEETEEENTNLKLLKSVKVIKRQEKDNWVKRVTLDEVLHIVVSMNYSLTLRKISQDQWLNYLFGDGKSFYSIKELMRKFGEYPFCWKDEKETKLLARYAVENNEESSLVENINRTQVAPIIKSILTKLIGKIKVYEEEEVENFYENLGEKLKKFSSLIKQSLANKQTGKKWMTREELEEGIQNAQLDINCEEVEFMVIFLFSWSRNLEELEIDKLGLLSELKVKWDVS